MINIRSLKILTCHLCAAKCSEFLCEGCAQSLPLLPESCPICALPCPSNDAPCGDCLEMEKPYRRTVCAFEYKSPIDQLLHQLKNGEIATNTRYLLPRLVCSIRDAYQDTELPDVIVPIPSHWRTRARRGYNPAEHIARQLSQALDIPMGYYLSKRSFGTSQKLLKRKERLANLKGCFECKHEFKGQKLRVALVDDIVTTCATVIRASQCLRSAGAASVDVWAFARTPK